MFEGKKGRHIIYDFGGWVEARIIEAAKMVDVCVVPICYQSPADLMSGVKTIYTLQQECPNIVILINNTDKTYVKELESSLKKRFEHHPVFIVNPSKYIARLAFDGKTVFDLWNEGGLQKYMLRSVLPQFHAFYDYLGNFKKPWEQ